MIYISPVSRIYDRRDIVLCSIFFLCYLLLGLVIYSDFGIPWDEPIQRITGGVSVKYIGQILAPKLLTGKIVGFPELSSWMDRDYGVAFEAPLVILEHWFSIHDERDVYLFRHLATFLFSYVGALAFFGIVRKWFGDYRLALVATLMFILSPRMFAESFYNSKDIVFMAGFTVAIFTMMSLVERPGFRQTLTHAFATAFTIDLRVTGILILATTLVVITVKLVKGEYRIWHFFRVTGGYTALVATFVIAMFPFLWTSPLENFITTCKNMLNFRWDGHVLYLGKVILATALPWHYLTTWISVTTPPLYLVLAMTGIMIALWQLARRRLALWGSDTEMYNLTFMALLVVPVIGISAIATVLYDGWRHMYFLYTPLMLLATLGLKTIIYWVRDRRILSALVAGIVACTLLINAHWIWSAHPLQNVYFNFLVGGDWKSKFSVDYWGLSNRDALDYILANDDSSVISIRADSATPLDRSLMIFPTDARERIVVRGSDSITKYVFTNYRQVKNRNDTQYLIDHELFHQKTVAGEIIYSIYKRRDAVLIDKITRTTREYTPDEFSALSLNYVGKSQQQGKWVVSIEVSNSSDLNFSALSSIGKPIRIAWRFVDEQGKPLTRWDDARKDLRKDIDPMQSMVIKLRPDPEKMSLKAGWLEVSLVQDGAYWAHDIGIAPLRIPLNE